MNTWLELGGIRSTAFPFITVENVLPAYVAKATHAHHQVGGIYCILTGKKEETAPLEVAFSLLVQGENRKSAFQNARAMQAWLQGKTLRHWKDENGFAFCVLQSLTMEQVGKRHIRLQGVYVCAPPYFLEAIGCPAFLPSPLLPLPEQISNSVRTYYFACKGSGEIPAFPALSQEPLAYLKIQGGFDTLHLGTLYIEKPKTTNATIYIDVPLQTVYVVQGENRVHLPHEGPFPKGWEKGVKIAGETVDIRLELLLLEKK